MLFFSNTRDRGPKWDQVIRRRIIDANGTVIEDTLFGRLPRQTDIKTVFWYCDDTEVALSKYFQQGSERESLRVKIPNLPNVFVVSIENANTGRVVSRCKD